MNDDDAGRFAYEGLSRVLHEKARLGILTALITHPGGLAFTEIARLCSLTDGNLSRHLDVLTEEGLIQIAKSFVGRRPHTSCKLTAAGRKQFRDYLAQLELVLRDAAPADPSTTRGKPRPGLAGT